MGKIFSIGMGLIFLFFIWIQIKIKFLLNKIYGFSKLIQINEQIYKKIIHFG